MNHRSTPLVIVTLLLLWPTAETPAQNPRGPRKNPQRRFDPAAFLTRLDKNQNGILEPAEMSDRTKGFIRSLGFDSDRPQTLSKIVSKIRSDRAAAEREKENSPSTPLPRNRKVPGFGIRDARSIRSSNQPVEGFGTEPTTNDPKQSKVPDFSLPAESATTQNVTSFEQQFGAEIANRVGSIMEQYDTNRNGVLDGQEIARVPWARPSPKESDLNKDGKLTRHELAERLLKRTQKSQHKTPPSPLTTRRPTTRSRPAKPTSNRSLVDRYQQYADALIKQYDKDKDGRLSQDEVSAMRHPPKNADRNRDGWLTRDELITSISEGTRSQSAGEDEANRNPNRGRRRLAPRSQFRAPQATPAGFESLDANQDGQIQMYEYAQKWDKKTLAEFDALDLNGDGILVRQEWDAGRSSGRDRQHP